VIEFADRGLGFLRLGKINIYLADYRNTKRRILKAIEAYKRA